MIEDVTMDLLDLPNDTIRLVETRRLHVMAVDVQNVGEVGPGALEDVMVGV
jgi:hypothetical protein